MILGQVSVGFGLNELAMVGLWVAPIFDPKLFLVKWACPIGCLGNWAGL